MCVCEVKSGCKIHTEILFLRSTHVLVQRPLESYSGCKLGPVTCLSVPSLLISCCHLFLIIMLHFPLILFYFHFFLIHVRFLSTALLPLSFVYILPSYTIFLHFLIYILFLPTFLHLSCNFFLLLYHFLP